MVIGSIFVFGGFLIVFGPGYFVPDWRILAYVCAVPGMTAAIIMFFLPETPYWLLEKNKMEAARYNSYKEQSLKEGTLTWNNFQEIIAILSRKILRFKPRTRRNCN